MKNNNIIQKSIKIKEYTIKDLKKILNKPPYQGFKTIISVIIQRDYYNKYEIYNLKNEVNEDKNQYTDRYKLKPFTVSGKWNGNETLDEVFESKSIKEIRLFKDINNYIDWLYKIKNKYDLTIKL